MLDFQNMGRGFQSFLKEKEKQHTKTYKTPPLTWPPFHDLRGEISKSHQSLLKTMARKPRGAGCREVPLAINTFSVADRIKKEGDSWQRHPFLFLWALFPYLCFFQSQLNFWLFLFNLFLDFFYFVKALVSFTNLVGQIRNLLWNKKRSEAFIVSLSVPDIMQVREWEYRICASDYYFKGSSVHQTACVQLTFTAAVFTRCTWRHKLSHKCFLKWFSSYLWLAGEQHCALL